MLSNLSIDDEDDNTMFKSKLMMLEFDVENVMSTHILNVDTISEMRLRRSIEVID